MNAKPKRQAGPKVIDRVRVAKEVHSFLDRRRPSPEIRPKLDFGFRFHGRCLELLEIRPRFQKPDEKGQHAFAKAIYVGTKGVWRVYWMRGTGKWHPYEPHLVKSLRGFLRLVDEDKHGCFFG